MSLLTYRVADHRVIELYEVIDIANAADITSELAPLIRRCPETSVVVDLNSGLLTVTGVRVLEEADALARRHGRTLHVAARSTIARKVLRLTHADQVLDVRLDLESVLSAD